MGSRMARNLLKAGYTLTVYNRSAQAARALEQQGARVASSVRDAVAEADIVFTMLSAPAVVEELILSPGGGMAAMKPGTLWVDCSTVHPSFSRAAHQRAQQHRIQLLDAPVAGTLPHAENGELVFFAGGASADLERVRPLLEVMGRKILHMGQGGLGSAFKMLVNALLGQAMVAFSEVFLLGERMGFSRDVLLNTLPQLPVTAPFLQGKVEMIRAGEYETQFPLAWMHKDLHLAAITAYELQQPLYGVNLIKELYAEAVRAGHGRADFAAIHELLSQRAGSPT